MAETPVIQPEEGLRPADKVAARFDWPPGMPRQSAEEAKLAQTYWPPMESGGDPSAAYAKKVVEDPFSDPAMQALKIREKEMADIDALQKSVNERNKEATKLAATPPPPPGLPQFRNMPDVPVTQLRSSFEAFKSPAIFLALMGSLASRKPLLGAMQAATGVMEGFQSGDKERVERERQIWKDQTDAAVKQNDVELSQYNAILANTKLSQTDKIAQITALATANRDEMTLAQIKSGAAGKLSDLFEHRQNAKERIVEAQARAGAKNRIDQAIVNELEHYPHLTQEQLGFIPLTQQPKVKEAFASAKNIERIAAFVKENPESIGLIANASRLVNLDAYKALAGADGKVTPQMLAKAEADMIDAVDRVSGTAGMDQASKAKILSKMLTTQAFTDAAAAGSRGATVFLDKAFKEIYDMRAGPKAFFGILETRLREANDTLKTYKFGLDDRTDRDTAYPFWMKKGEGYVREMEQRAKYKPGFVREWTDDNGVKHKSIFKGGNPTDQNSWTEAQ